LAILTYWAKTCGKKNTVLLVDSRTEVGLEINTENEVYVVLTVHLITVENLFHFTNLCTISYNSINLPLYVFRLINSHPQQRELFFDKCSQIMAYADDVVIMGRRLQDVKEVFTSLMEQANKMGLEINEKKDKIYDSITKALQRE
jgi:hypothetical protein